MDPALETYRNELLIVYQKGQDAFEQQLVYISGGALALSIGFIKDIVGDIASTHYSALLTIGWIFLGVTLLLNLISHLVSTRKINEVIKSINEGSYDPAIAISKFKKISWINWSSVGSLAFGLTLIVFFITINI
jgi:predicted lysophospholipase L1 biosynthesis ABC-type transport system permease subunit